MVNSLGKRARLILVATGVLFALCPVSGKAQIAPLPTSEAAIIGRKIGDFRLQDYLGAAHSLHDWQDKK